MPGSVPELPPGAQLCAPVAPRGGRPSERRPERFYPGADENALHFALVASNALARLPWPLVLALAVAWAALVGLAAAWLTTPAAGAALALSLLAAIAGDAAVITAAPRRRLSYGPFGPQLLLLAAPRGAAALALAGLARLARPAGPDAVLLLANLAVQIVGSVLALRGFLVEPARLGISHRRVVDPRVRAALRVLQVGDLHIERRSRREALLQAAIDRLQPDLLLFTGDFLNLSCVYDRRAWAETRAVLAGWHARYGVFAVSGSPLVDPPEVAAALLADLPIVWLRDQCALAGPPDAPVRLIGISCTHVPEDDALTLGAVLADAPGAELFTVLLYHSPDLAPQAAGFGVDLQLAGHTHGGQVRLPLIGALLTSSLHGKRFEMGAYTLGRLQLYVARGVGLEGQGAPRVRLGCEPEIVYWDLQPAGGETAENAQ